MYGFCPGFVRGSFQVAEGQLIPALFPLCGQLRRPL